MLQCTESLNLFVQYQKTTMRTCRLPKRPISGRIRNLTDLADLVSIYSLLRTLPQIRQLSWPEHYFLWSSLSSCARTPHRRLKLQKRFTNLSSDSRRCSGEKNTWDPIKILYFLHVLPFSPWDSQFKPMSENTSHSI